MEDDDEVPLIRQRRSRRTPRRSRRSRPKRTGLSTILLQLATQSSLNNIASGCRNGHAVAKVWHQRTWFFKL